MIPSYIQKQQIVKPKELSPPKKDVVFEFQNFRRDTQLRAQTASITFLQPTNLEQFQKQSSQKQQYSIEALLSKKQREAADAAWDKLSPATVEQPLSSSQSFQSQNGFLSSTLQKERDQSFERQFSNTFHSRQKKQLQQNLLSPRRDQKSKASLSTLSSQQFSPEKRVQTPSRYIQRLGSSFSSSSSTKNRQERRSKSIQQGGLQELFQETKSKAQMNQVTPSRPRTNSQSFLKSSEAFQTTQAAFVVDKRAHDLEETLMGLNPKDFNSLPRESIEQLIKLSSVIMTKVKSSNFYKTSVF